MRLSIEQATRVHKAAAAGQVSRFLTDDMDIQRFVRSLALLGRRLGEERQDVYWQPILRNLRRVRYELTSVPLSLDHEALGLRAAAEALEKRLRNVEALFPGMAAAAHAVSQQLNDLADLSNDALADAIEAVLQNSDRTNQSSVLIRAPQFLGPVREHLRSRGIRTRVLTAESLTGDVVAEELIAIGPKYWFPSYVTAAPRSVVATFVHFRWIADPEREEQAFPVTFPGSKSFLVSEHPRSQQEEPTPLVDAEELLPVIDWHAISRGSAAGSHDADVTPAALFLLADGFAVYLDSQHGSRAYIVDPEADDDDRVRQEPVRQLGPGSFLLLRSEGGGDYIRPLADQILREKAVGVRALQKEWKDLLRARVSRDGTEAVAQHLRNLGSAGATDLNVRYWSSYDTIATGNVTDFAAIMRLVGQQERTEGAWAAMQLIRAAHVRAGQHIRKLLSREVIAANAAELRERGVSHFELEALGKATLSVFRVEAKSPDPIVVSRSHLRHPFRVGRDLWHG